MPNVTTTIPSPGVTLHSKNLWKWKEMESEWVWMKYEYKSEFKDRNERETSEWK